MKCVEMRVRRNQKKRDKAYEKQSEAMDAVVWRKITESLLLACDARCRQKTHKEMLRVASRWRMSSRAR